MAADLGGSDRITHSQVITSTLVTIGYPETMDRDLDFCAEVLTRAVAKMKRHEQSVNFHDVTEKERLRAIFVLNTMYEVEKKLKQQQANEQHTQQVLHQQQHLRGNSMAAGAQTPHASGIFGTPGGAPTPLPGHSGLRYM
jgi:hypothetical protein